jgi:hypothetical protein
MLTIIEKLIVTILKSCILFFVITILSMHLVSKLKQEKGLISYYKINGITTFNKHVNANHAIVAKTIEGEINSPLKKTI